MESDSDCYGPGDRSTELTMTRKALTVLLILGLLVSPTAVAGINDVDDPRIVTYVPSDTLTPGQTNRLTVLLQNVPEDADDYVYTAKDTRVTVKSGDTPFTVLSGTQVVGPLGNRSMANVSAQVRVPEGTPAGTYKIPLRLEYHFNDAGDPFEEEVTETVYATVRVEERPRFVVNETSSDVGVGGTGTISVTMTNVGEENASNAAVNLQSGVPDITFNGAQSTKRFVGSWDAGETKTIEYEARVRSSAESRSYAFSAAVSYEDEEGQPGQSSDLTVGVRPTPDGSFGIRNVQSTLRVGDEGTVSGTIVNGGEVPLRNAVLLFGNTSPTVTPIETEYAVGTVRPGERANFTFDVEVSSDAEPGPRQFDMRLRYRNAGDDLITSGQKDVRVQVGKDTPEFDVQPVNATLSAGGNGELELQITNNRDQPLSDISAKVYAESPLTASDSEAFVDRLGPGETANLTFGVSAGGEALEKTYPLKVDFQYDNAEGETRISDTYQVPVQVDTGNGGSLPLPLIVAAVVLLGLVVGGYLYTRRE